MSEQNEKRDLVRDLLANYPDCPQREMALNLVRRGLVDQAKAWIDALDDLQQRGQSKLFAKPKKTGHGGG